MSGHSGPGSQRRAQDVLTCRLCSQYMTDPRQLPCGHSFCLRCLQRYFESQCKRSPRPGLRRSPSADHHHRSLLPCPAAPICLHVTVVPDGGVAAFPVNVNITNLKEHVVNEMAYNISQRIGLASSVPHRTHSDTESVRSDETGYSAETTSSAPAGSQSTSRYPNLAKYAKYFEAESGGLDSTPLSTSSAYTPRRRAERQRVPMTSSFQHRRRRVQRTTSPAAFDNLQRDLSETPKQPSRSGSAPHLDTLGADEIGGYRPSVRRRQAASATSPLLIRRARPTSCILEELVPDNLEDDDLVGRAQRPSETLRHAAFTETVRQPMFHEPVLPTHRENISTDRVRRSVPPPRSQNLSENIDKTSSPTQSGTASHSTTADKVSKSYTPTTASEPAAPHKPDDLVINEPVRPRPVTQRPGRRILPTVPTDQQTEAIIPDKSRRNGPLSPENQPQADSMSPGSHRSRHLPRVNEHGKTERHTTADVDTQSNDPKKSKSSFSGPSESRKSQSCTDSSGRKQPVTPDVKLSSDDRNRDKQTRDPKPSSSTFSRVLHPEKSQPSSANLSDSKHRTTRTSRRSPTSTAVPDAVNSVPGRTSHTTSTSGTKPSVSPGMSSSRHSKSYVSQNKSYTTASTSTDKSNESRKFAPSITTPKSTTNPAATRNKRESGEPTERTGKPTSNPPGPLPSHGPHADPPSQARSSEKNIKQSVSSPGTGKPASSTPGSGPLPPRTPASDPHTQARSSEKKNMRSESSPGIDRSGGGAQCRSKSTGGSGSRLTYKVNASTVHPVLINLKKNNLNAADVGRRHSTDRVTNRDSISSDDFDLDIHDLNITGGASPNNKKSCNLSTPVGSDPNKTTSVAQSTEQEAGPNVSPASDGSKQDASTTKTNGKTDESTSAANIEKEAKKREQWATFTRTLQAARTKYSSSEKPAPTTETTPSNLPLYGDGVVLRWRIQRDDFAVPTSVVIANDGTSVVADISNCLLDYIDTEGNVQHGITGTKPFSVAISKDDKVYVGDRRSRTVRVFDIYGCDVAQWDAEATNFGWIAGIAVLNNGQLAIMDRERCKVGVYSAGGERITEFGSYGSRDSQICMADFLAVDSHNRIVVTDSGNHRLQLFDASSGKRVATFGARGEADGCLLWPKGVAVDSSDNVIVADSGNDRISEFSADGRFISHLMSSVPKPYHVTYGANNLLGVTHFALNGASQVEVFALGATN